MSWTLEDDNSKVNTLEEKLCLNELSPMRELENNPNARNMKAIPKFSQTYEMLMYVCEKDGLALKHASKKLITPELCEVAVRQNGLALEYVPKNIVAEMGYEWYRNLFKPAVSSNGSALKLIPDEEKTEEIVETALLIGKTPDGRMKLWTDFPVSYVPKTLLTKELLEKLIERAPLSIKDAPKNRITKRLSNIAVQHDGLTLKYVPNRFMDKKMIEAAVTENAMAICFVPEQLLTQDMCDASFDRNPSILAYIPANYITKKMCLKVINRGCFSLSNYGRTLILEMEGTPYDHVVHFKDMPEELRNDKDILQAIICTDSENINSLLTWNSIVAENSTGITNERKEIVKPLKIKTVKYLKEEQEKYKKEQDKWIAKAINNVKTDNRNKEQLKLPSSKEVPKTYSLVPRQNDKLLTYDFTENDTTNVRFYYISDIHIEHQLLKIKSKFKNKPADVRLQLISRFISENIKEMVSGINNREAILLIGGDVADSPFLTMLFYHELRNQWHGGQIISVLGNHELWDGTTPENWNDPYFVSRSIEEIICDYKERIQKHWRLRGKPRLVSVDTGEKPEMFPSDSVLLENELFITYKNGTSRKISEEDILSAPEEALSDLLSKCTLIILGGIGYSGLNPVYNSNCGLYRKAICSLEEDIRRSKVFKTVHDKIKKCAGNRRVIVLSHTPVYDWSTQEPNTNWIYVNGHTHQNTISISENGAMFLSDNQIGYKPSKWTLKSFIIDRQWYDPFENYNDGIYKITSDEYAEFNRGRGILCNGCSYKGTLYMLKRNSIYMFLLESDTSLCLMVGGQRKRLEHYDVDYYYNNMEKYGERLKALITPYQKVLMQLSEEVKRFGGIGRMHGCIVDISFFSHIYLNPLDGKITPYWAYDMTARKAYVNVKTLIEHTEPQLLKHFLIESKKNTIPLIGANTSNKDSNTGLATIPKWAVGTDIYEPSRIIRSIQYVWDQNIIRIWNDAILQETANDNKYQMIEKNRR